LEGPPGPGAGDLQVHVQTHGPILPRIGPGVRRRTSSEGLANAATAGPRGPADATGAAPEDRA
ncbi:MAG TPA: hypothetical protein VGK17_24245, partial [Propionicimonas sp.]